MNFNKDQAASFAVSGETRRLDIDLLRAIAVVAVLLFHFQVPGFDGGFLGVDIFFVISGFLISTQLQKQISDKKFSYFNFVARRARRLAPAYAVTLILTGAAGLFLLPPDVFNQLLTELRFSSAYLSNFLFWQESGYFDTNAISKPLLHTWSLAVEEQFYLVWPGFLLLIPRNRSLIGLIAVGSLSFVACEIALRSNESAAFFLFPFRIFEFAIGALIPYLRIPKENGAKTLLNILAICGLILPVFIFDERTRFPGTSVVPTCLSTAWLIAARPFFLNSRNALSIIGETIGKLSYSAYLIHWPLVVFYVQIFGEKFDFLSIFFLLGITTILSWLMWRWVEMPCLKSRIRVLFFLPTIPATFLIVFSLALYGPAAYNRVHADRTAISDLLTSLDPRKEMAPRLLAELRESQRSLVGATRVSVVGDSHAIDGALALKAGSGDSMHVSIVHSSCDPIANVIPAEELEALYSNHSNKTATAGACAPVHEQFINTIIKTSPDIIVFSENWREDAFPYLKISLKQLKGSTQAVIVILGKNQEFQGVPSSVLKSVSSPLLANRESWSHRSDASDLNSRLKSVAEQAGAIFIDKAQLVCPTKGSCDYLQDDQLTYWDRSHWTEAGVNIFGRRLVDRFRENQIVK
jgi:peptidoglycan/LPS O-acetylase OafA/YrhL